MTGPDQTTAPPLTDEERRLLAMVAAGLTHDQIGRRTQRGRTAIANHLTRIYKQLGARNAPNAVAIAISLGLIFAAGPDQKRDHHQ